MTFLLYKRHTKEKSLWVIFFYILYCTINEFVGYYLNKIHFEYIFVVFAFFTVIEFTFFSLFFYYALPSRSVKRGIFILLGVFLAFSFIDFFLVNQMNSFDSIAVGVESILIILMCIFYLIAQIRGNNNLFVYSTSNFWVIITFLIYISGTFFLYIMAENMIQTKSFHDQYIIINSVFNILKNILLSVAMLMKSQPVINQNQKNKEWDDPFSYNLKN